MSQQKVIFAVVLVAGCVVALASSQSMDYQQCAQTGQQLVSDYTSNLQSAFQKFTTQASQTGSSTFDMQKINDQTNQIMKELQKLVNPNGFNFEQTMSTYMNLVRMQTSLLTSFFNTSGGLAMGRAYMELMSTMMTVNSGFAMDMATACVPQLRANYKGPSN